MSSLFLSHFHAVSFVSILHVQVIRYTFAQGCVLVSMDRDIDSSRDQNPHHVAYPATQQVTGIDRLITESETGRYHPRSLSIIHFYDIILIILPISAVYAVMNKLCKLSIWACVPVCGYAYVPSLYLGEYTDSDMRKRMYVRTSMHIYGCTRQFDAFLEPNV